MTSFVMLLLIVPLVLCPTTSVHDTDRVSADFTSITNHINVLEHQISMLQIQFDSELKSTLTDLTVVRILLKATQAENQILRDEFASTCRLLNQTSQRFNVTSLKAEFTQLKNEISETKSSCVANKHAIINVKEVVDAVCTNVSYEVQLTHTLTSVQEKDILLFDNVTQRNTDGYYNASTGVFTAPVNGSYLIWASIRLKQPNSFINIYAHRDGDLINYGHAETSSGAGEEGVASLMGVASLRAGDRVWFTKGTGSHVIHGGPGEHSSSYGGTLLRKH